MTNLAQLPELTVPPTADFPSIAKLKTLNFFKVFIGPSEELSDFMVFQNFQHLDKLWINFDRLPTTLSDDDLKKLKVMLPGVEIKVTGGK